MERDDSDSDLDAMKSSRESQSLKQGLQKGYFHDKSYDILQEPLWKKSFRLNSQSMELQRFRGESGQGVSRRMEMTKHPNSPSPSCSPLNQHDNDTAASASLSFSFFPQSEFCLGEEVAGSIIITEENEGIQNTFDDSSKSTSAVLVNPWRVPAPKPYKGEIYPQPRIQQGYSVRRANFPRRYCHSEPQIVLLEETQDNAPVSSEIEVVQPDTAKYQDSNASNAPKNAAKDPKNSSEGFESSNPVENFHLPATEEEENLGKNDTSIQVLSGTNGSSSKPTNEEVHVGDQNVEERSGYTANIEGRDDREADTRSLQGVSRAYFIRLKKEEERIMAWEREQIAKANENMKNFERKLQKKRAEEMWKTQKKIARAHKKAENRMVAKRTKFEAASVGEPSLANRIRSGKLPWKWVSATVCCAFVR